ncbi:MAG: nuclear transport factor 2 family protein [Steroidobacteraceae bacterium]
MKKLIWIAVLGFATASLSAHAEPRQSWAHKDGVVKLQNNGVKVQNDNALDRLLIQEAFSRWGIAHDEGQLEVVRSLFTKDGEVQVMLGNKELLDSAKGNDNIVKMVTNSLSQQQDQRRHAMTNIVIDKLTKNEATGIAYGIVTLANDGLTLGASVIYRGELKKEADGVWRFSKFVIGMDYYAGKRIVNLPK